jgi:GH25 family lysozyme M1 (1,4-beta-N-acetylmuramidase)
MYTLIIHAQSSSEAASGQGAAGDVTPAAPGGSAALGPAADALRRGERDENRLTNLAFHARHPELQGRRLRADERSLIREWLDIRDRLTRPALSAFPAGRVTSAIPRPSSGTPTPTAAANVIFGLDTYEGDRNKNPNWAQTKTKADIRFAIIRSNWGVSEDSIFKREWPRIKDAGTVRGAFLFLRFPHPYYNMKSPDPAAQAKAMIKTVGPLNPSDLPPTVDVEFPGGRQVTGLTAQQCLDQVRVACKVLKDYYGVAPMIYTSARVWTEDLNDLPAPDLVESPLWLAKPWPYQLHAPVVLKASIFAGGHLDPKPPPSWGPGNWWIHQYQGDADARALPGFAQVDIDRFNPLQGGATGDRVKWVQRRLGVAQSGQFDAAMTKAVGALQNEKGLAASGVVDLPTFTYLCWQNP